MSREGAVLRNADDAVLDRLRRFLETKLGPAPRPTDAQIGMIMGFVQKELQKTGKTPKKK
jgi:hypothetical protein